MGVYKSIENGEPLSNKTIPCEALKRERVTTIPKGSTSKQREAVDADNSVKR
nr:MAG TPA: hypothetical protein [Bacteriophage sp.]